LVSDRLQNEISGNNIKLVAITSRMKDLNKKLIYFNQYTVLLNAYIRK